MSVKTQVLWKRFSHMTNMLTTLNKTFCTNIYQILFIVGFFYYRIDAIHIISYNEYHPLCFSHCDGNREIIFSYYNKTKKYRESRSINKKSKMFE